MNWELILVGVGVSIGSSLLTLAFAYLLFRWKLKELLYQELDELSISMKEKLREGVTEAGKELMPEFREEVREGFKEALTSAMSGDLIEMTAKQVAKNSTNIVEQGLGMLLGRRPEEYRK